MSVTAITSALVFGANLHALVDEPARYGWATDLAIASGGGYEYVDPGGGAAVAKDPAVRGVSVAAFGPEELDGTSTSTIGVVTVAGRPPATVVHGRVPAKAREVALGARTARQLGVGVGDSVSSRAGDLAVVGIVALPAVGQQASAHPTLGQGALMTLDGLAALDPDAYPVLAMISLRPGHDAQAEEGRMRALVAKEMTSLPVDFTSAFTDLRPGEIRGLAPAVGTANALAGALGIAAVLALILTVGASVRRRSRTFATLRAIGFDGPKVRAAVRWQTNVLVATALLIGLPAGIVLGRLAWIAFATDLGVAPAPVLPLVLLAAVALALVVVANLAGEAPARRATHTPVTSLRAGQ